MSDAATVQSASNAFIRSLFREQSEVGAILSILDEELMPAQRDRILVRAARKQYESGKPLDPAIVASSINGDSRHFPFESPSAYIEEVLSLPLSIYEQRKTPSRFEDWAGILRQAKRDSDIKAAATTLIGDPHNEQAVDAIKTALEPIQKDLINARSLADFAEMEIDTSKTLLGDRFLCVEGGMLFVGQSGIGKSSASAQQDVMWSIGNPAFGIRPSRPLKILCIQAENDEGDMIEFSKGIIDGLNFSNEDRRQVKENTIYVSHKETTGPSFVAFMERCLRQFRPDIVRIDPLNAYLGDDPKETKATQTFLRNMVNPLLKKYQCATIINHHTPKTIFQGDKTNWTVHDWMYAGAGGADITNWARSILIVDSCKDDKHTFKFIAAKRGSRIGWADGAGDPVDAMFFRHSRKPGIILWEQADEVYASSIAKPRAKDDILHLVPLDKPMEKKALISKAQTFGIGLNKANGWIAELVDDGKLYYHFTKRHRTRDMVEVARYPQSEVNT
jgi:hypothetical protein